jgi:two-component system cell cycle sensor histidine kinase/response regulator CckA
VKPARGETVLLVEDEAPIRMLLARTLENSGYTVLQANDGREALEVAKQKMGPIELLVADIVMPKLGGIELAKELRAVRRDVRVLFLTGYTDSPTPLLDERTGFLQKPFTSRALLQEVRRLLDHTEVSKNA